jgi:glucokinase
MSDSAPTLLAVDLGGTHTRLRLASDDAPVPQCRLERHVRTADFPDLATLLRQFFQDTGARPPSRTCLAIAGPVWETPAGQRARVTRLQWDVDVPALQRELGLERLRLINDFEAIGHALEGIPPDELQCLQPGEPETGGTRALIGAGTGLGQALLFQDGSGYRVLPTEGGHADFAPGDALQLELLRDLQQTYDHVSWDRLVSGPGLALIHDFLCRRNGQAPGLDPQGAETPARISQQALEDGAPLAGQALELFLRLFGAQTGNLALTAMARGGIFIAGGIAPRILPRLGADAFLHAFRHKGRMTELMQRFPVHLVLTKQPGLLGASLVARRL